MGSYGEKGSVGRVGMEVIAAMCGLMDQTALPGVIIEKFWQARVEQRKRRKMIELGSY